MARFSLFVVVVIIALASASSLSGRLAARLDKSHPGLILSPEQVDDSEAFETDIQLFPDQLLELQAAVRSRRARRKASEDRRRLWPRGIVPFVIDPSINEAGRKNILRAMHIWEQNTCIVFQYRQPGHILRLGHSAYVLFTNRPGCSSNVGRNLNGGATVVFADQRCSSSVMTLAHELGHVLGLFHEQSRPDRDNFIKIDYQAIQPNKITNFMKYDHLYTSSSVPYDYDSIMHYGANVDGKDEYSITIKTRDTTLQGSIGQRSHLSFYDVKLINDLYQCIDVVRKRRSLHQVGRCSPEVLCLNEGYVGPYCFCVCPPVLHGKRCDLILPSKGECGGVLTENSGTIVSPAYPENYPSSLDCHWLIQGDRNSTIEVNFHEFELEEDDPLCDWDRVEIRGRGPHQAATRYCGTLSGAKLPKVQYHGSALYLRFVSDGDYNYKGFRATYRIHKLVAVGTWSDWTPWTSCPVTCGKAIVMRFRKCKVPPCQGLALDLQPCVTHC